MDATGIGGKGDGAGMMTSALDQQKTLGAQVVTGTLNKLNTNDAGQVNPDYDFQTKVLSGMGIGKHLNTSA